MSAADHGHRVRRPAAPQCWHAAGAALPAARRVPRDGPAVPRGRAPCRDARAARNARLRREALARPVIFVGTGTCGLGAGAGKTLAAIRALPRAAPADRRRRGRGRLHRPLRRGADRGRPAARPHARQLPARHREAGGRRCSTPSSRARRPRSTPLGQFRDAAARRPWADVPFLDEHPFFAPQTRWVLANCGIIDPGQHRRVHRPRRLRGAGQGAARA